MTLYYQDEAVTLWHGDCLVIDDWTSADVLVTDPPYGMAFQSNQRKGSKLAEIAGDRDTEARDAALAMWGSDRPALVFGRWSVPAPEGERLRLIWWKEGNPGMGDLAIPWGPAHEDIHLLGRGWNREATGQKREGSVIPTRGVRGGASWRGERHGTPDSEASWSHGAPAAPMPARCHRGPVRRLRSNPARREEPGQESRRCRTRGTLLRGHRQAADARHAIRGDGVRRL